MDLRPILKIAAAALLVWIAWLALQRSGVNPWSGILALLSFAPLIALYLLPGIVASRRKKANRQAIWVVTILLGWTVIGWIAALIWAFLVEEKDQRAAGGPVAR